MTSARCPRTWEIEAARDGRLTGEAASSLGAHVRGCAACRREVVALTDLARRLQDVNAGHDDIAVRRLRQRVLEGADSVLTRRPSAAWVRLVLPALAVLALAVLYISRKAPVPEMVVTVRAEQGAVFAQPGRERITLRDGTLHLAVQHRGTTRGLVVVVPDGEIEDVGTTFTVTVEKERTTHIVVEEGAVAFRRTNLPVVVVVPGAPFSVVPEPAPVVASPPPTPAPVASAPPKARVLKRTHVDAGSATPPEPAVDEDAAYLRVVSLLRAGKRDEAREAASSYLQRFPRGFRRPEVLRVLSPVKN